MDETKRNVIASIGGGVIGFGGPLTWIPTTMAAHYHWPVIVLPPIGMFIVGMAIMTWGLRGGDTFHARRKRIVREWRGVTHLPEPSTTKWSRGFDLSRQAMDLISQCKGPTSAQGFRDATKGLDHPTKVFHAQIDYLKSLPRWRRDGPLR